MWRRWRDAAHCLTWLKSTILDLHAQTRVKFGHSLRKRIPEPFYGFMNVTCVKCSLLVHYVFEGSESEIQVDPHDWLVEIIADAVEYCNLNGLETTGIAFQDALLVLRAELTVLAEEKLSKNRENRLHS